MRAVAFEPRLALEFKGNITRNAMCLGDVDNDGNHEFVVGNVQGDLAIFKGEQTQAWAESHDLGMIMVIEIGDILNEGKNSTVCISSDGMLNIFNMKSENSGEIDRRNLVPFHIQRLPANTKVAMLADVDCDGEVELVLGLTDHVLRTYRWVKFGQNSNNVTGKLVGLHKWEFADQVGSISLSPSPEGSPFVLVAQPGGTYINIQCPIVEVPENGVDASDSTLLSKLTPKRHALASSRMRNPSISSEILGGICGIRDGSPTSSLIAIATLDGTLMLVDGDEIIWSLQVDHQLFAINKLDLIGDGHDDVVACAWDGLTYMVNQKRQSVRFQFEEQVCTFASGHYSVNLDGKKAPAFAYATFHDKIYLYYDVVLPSFEIQTLLDTVEDQHETAEILSQLDVDSTNTEQLRNLYRLCLYDFPSLLKNVKKL